MSTGLFVTGTDTGVGKTVVSAALMCRYRASVPLRYWKPIQTGIEQDDDTAMVRTLAACPAGEIVEAGVRLRRSVSPHLAAAWAGVTIDIAPLVERRLSAPESPAWIVEGAGGCLVPVNEHEMMVDLMRHMGLAALVVARTALGTINHTLLTLEALRGRGIPVAGVVLVGAPDVDARAAIVRYGAVDIVGDMPALASVTPATLAWWAPALDTANRLLKWLQ